ncbi:c-Myc-binding protein homolog [Telopea speciosissima]|uniref:c-Myc-binding protein homolog n=1 Tax=Telopea speciosissima TaxID=54955 RepID=UPI001CC337AC|nr:c-Myc-binding protein homolog [Telopea speciosissima]
MFGRSCIRCFIHYSVTSFSKPEKIHLGWGLADAIEMDKEAKKEAFRKYLESSGVLDALTKVLVALYEQNDKPSSAIEFIQQKLCGPTVLEHERLQAEMSDLQIKYNELLAAHKKTRQELEELRNSQPMAASKNTVDAETPKDGL